MVAKLPTDLEFPQLQKVADPVILTAFVGLPDHANVLIPSRTPIGFPSACTHMEVHRMNSDQISGNWKQFSGKVKEKWGKLTDDDLTQIAGKKEQLLGRIQERYGMKKEEAQKEIDEFYKTHSEPMTAKAKSGY